MDVNVPFEAKNDVILIQTSKFYFKLKLKNFLIIYKKYTYFNIFYHFDKHIMAY